MSSVIKKLQSMIQKVEKLGKTVTTLSPKPDEWQEIKSLALKLTQVATCLVQDIEVSKTSREVLLQQTVQEAKEKAQSHFADISNEGRLRYPKAFRKNIVLVFNGPESSPYHSKTEQSRNETTSERSAVLRGLNADGIICWTISYNSSSWIGGKMGWDVFYNLAYDIEPSERQSWPDDVINILKTVQEHELSGNPDYEAFMKVVQNRSIPQEPRLKRQGPRLTESPPLLSILNQCVEFPSFARQEVRDLLPEPFLQAVMASQAWASELNDGRLAITNCISVFCPKGPDDRDGLFVARLGYKESFRFAEQLSGLA